MISLNDYDTGFSMDPTLIKKLRSKCIILIDQLNNVPIFFVKESTIDNYCTSECLNPDCPKELLRYYDKRIEEGNITLREAEEVIKRLENCLQKCVPIGCYIQQADDISDKPHILICPERIKYRNKYQFQDILIEVIIHELTHAYFSTGADLKDISKHIIEESLCEAYAFSRFENTEQIFEFVADQTRPPEYTGFKFWIEISNNVPLILLMNEWRNKKYKNFPRVLFPEYLTHSWRRYESLEEVAYLVLTQS